MNTCTICETEQETPLIEHCEELLCEECDAERRFTICCDIARATNEIIKKIREKERLTS